MISLHQLRTFLIVAETGSVRAAAERLVVSQPAVSSALAGLARNVGTAVVERDGRGVCLTAAGLTLAAYGRRAFALLDEAVAETRASAALAPARVRIAAVTTAAEQLLPLLLAGFGAPPNRVAVDLAVANRAAVWDKLAHDEVDLVIAGRPPDVRFATLALRPNALVIVSAAGAAPDAAALGMVPWLIREPGSGTRDATTGLFEALGIAPPTITIGSNGAIRNCVVAGLGVALLSRDAVREDLDAHRLAEIATPRTPLVREWHLVGRAAGPALAGVERFVAHAVEIGAFRRP